MQQITLPDDKDAVFVFGSNEGGIHGAGAALTAVQEYGAITFQIFGLAGRSFAIPTQNRRFQTLPLWAIEQYVKNFLRQAQERYPEKTFYVTQIGLAGYKPSEIAPMFKEAPKNVILPPEFAPEP